MKILSVAIQKGGQGKTFLSCHLAFDLMRKNKKVLFIDLDTQANASYTLSNEIKSLDAYTLYTKDIKSIREAVNAIKSNAILFKSTPELIKIESVDLLEAKSKLLENLKGLSDLFDICIIDTPPSLGIAMTSAISVSDYLISPVQLELYSLNGVKQLLTVVANLRKNINQKLVYLGMVANLFDSRRKRHKDNLLELRKNYGTHVLNGQLKVRDVNAEALEARIPLWEIKRHSAKIAEKEFTQVANEIYSKMNIK